MKNEARPPRRSAYLAVQSEMRNVTTVQQCCRRRLPLCYAVLTVYSYDAISHAKNYQKCLRRGPVRLK